MGIFSSRALEPGRLVRIPCRSVSRGKFLMEELLLCTTRRRCLYFFSQSSKANTESDQRKSEDVSQLPTADLFLYMDRCSPCGSVQNCCLCSWISRLLLLWNFQSWRILSPQDASSLASVVTVRWPGLGQFPFAVRVGYSATSRWIGFGDQAVFPNANCLLLVFIFALRWQELQP